MRGHDREHVARVCIGREGPNKNSKVHYKICTERDIADKIELEKLVEVFKLANHRKIPL